MFIIKYFRPDNSYYYLYSRYLHAHQKIGYINQFNHEIIDINFIDKNKVWSYEEYITRECFKKKDIKNDIIDKIINFLEKRRNRK